MVIGTLHLKRSHADGVHVFQCPMSAAELAHLAATWKPDLSKLTKPWGCIDGLPIWRCNTMLLVSGPMTLEGREISDSHRRN
jgi:hypothetical protein